MEFIDSSLIVEFLCKSGFYHDHVPPVYLEKLPLNERGRPLEFSGKDPGENLICSASLFMKGKDDLEWFSKYLLEWYALHISAEIHNGTIFHKDR